MTHKFLPCLVAAVAALTMSLPALAAGPALSGESSATANLTVYGYQPAVFRNSGTSFTGNSVLCSGSERIYDDRGNLYRVTDSAPLSDSALFRSSRKVTSNATEIKRVTPMEDSSLAGTSFVVTLEDIYRDQSLVTEITATYTALQNTALEVVPLKAGASVTPQTLTVQKGAEITAAYKLTITPDDLYRTSYDNAQVTPGWYGDVLLLKDPDFPAGVDELLVTPKRNGDSDVDWKSGDDIVAQLDLTGASIQYPSKLETSRSATSYSKNSSFGEFYVRFFRNHPVIDGTATLTLTNPFLTFEGVETVPHQDVFIYEVTDTGALRNITSQCSYGEDTDENGAFLLKTNHLGSYVLSSKKLAF